MKKFKAAMAMTVGAAALLCASAASAATVYNLDTYAKDSGFKGSLGTVTVGGEGTSTLSFTVSLNPNVFYQITGASSPLKPHDSFWFDLDKVVGGAAHDFNGKVTWSISAPNGPASGTGDYGNSGKFTGANGDIGQGWSSGDYGLQVSDSSRNHGDLDYYSGDLIFTVHANDGSALTLDPTTFNNSSVKGTVFGGADLRQCPGADPTPSHGSCTTGPVGFSLAKQTSAVPEPATWAIMLMGFGGLGAMLRQRRGMALVRA